MAFEDVSAVADVVDNPTEEVDVVDAVATEDTDAEAPVDAAAPDTAVAEEFTVDGRTIPAHVRELFKNPAGGKEAKVAWMERGEFRKTFPEGPKQAVEAMAMLSDIGGKDGLEAMRGETTGLKDLFSMLQSGNEQALDRLQTEAPDALPKLAPAVMSRWYQQDPEGCNKTLCGVIANTLSSGQFDTQIERAQLFFEVGKPEKAIEVLEGMKKWAQSFGETANKPLTPKQAPEVDKRVQDLDQRETQIFNKDLSSKIVSFRDPLIEKELAPWVPKGQTLSDGKKQIINREVVQQASAILDGDRDFQNKWKSFIGNRDAEGATKLSRSKLTEILPEVVKSVAREVLGSPAVKKAAPAPTTPVLKPNGNIPSQGKTFDEIFDAATR